MREEIRREFGNPDPWYRSFPFWAWNGNLKVEELKRQIKEMKEKGCGGFFIHSREGLETEYMGAEWMECVKAAVEEAKNQGMYAWLYDEDRWPSGTAGGKVTAKGDLYRCKGLTLQVCKNPEEVAEVEMELEGIGEWNDHALGFVALYGAKIKGMEMESFRRFYPGENWSLKDDEALLAARLEVSGSSEWFNGEGPPDPMNPQCVRAFLEETHEKYNKAVGESFGTVIPGIFSDEPSLHDTHASFLPDRGWIPWTLGYGAYFMEKRGYDILDVLPWLYFNGKESSGPRHDYWYTNSLRFGDVFFGTIASWCREHGLAYTGHFLQEGRMGLCTRVNGSVMSHYPYLDVPGIDMLGMQDDEFLTVKQCSSVARQFGKKKVLSETYGCTGWELTFEGQKWMGDWQYALGINSRCQHLSLYSIKGCRKRDYPPSFLSNNCWWKGQGMVEDYFARLSLTMEMGEADCRILLLHPISTVWSRLGTNPYGNPVRRLERDIPELDAYGEQLNDLIQYLERQHLDCDLGDEILMGQYGQVVENTLVIGRSAYEAVVVPPVDTLFISTLKLLYGYLELGGKVMVLGSPPFLAEGRKGHEKLIAQVFDHPGCFHAETKNQLPKLLEFCRTVSILGESGEEQEDILYQLRAVEDGWILFTANHSREKEVTATISLDLQGTVEEWDLLTGKTAPYEGVSHWGEGIRLPVFYGKTASKLFYIKKYSVHMSILDQPCKIKCSHPNIMTLDQCRYKLDGGEEVTLSEPMEIWQAQKQVREQLGMRQIHTNGIQQRYRWVHRPHPSDGRQLTLVFSFDSEADGVKASLAAEDVGVFKIRLDGVPLDCQAEGWLLDLSFETIPLPILNKGPHVLEITCAYANHMELENMYLAGDFGVSEQGSLTDPVRVLLPGDWCHQGLPYYCGSVCYQYEYVWSGRGLAVTLQIPEICAAYVILHINGGMIKIPWQMTEETDITGGLGKGRNTITIEVMGSPVNMLEPWRGKGGEEEFVGYGIIGGVVVREYGGE